MYEFINDVMNPTAAFMESVVLSVSTRGNEKMKWKKSLPKIVFFVLGFKNLAKFPLEDKKKKTEVTVVSRVVI